MVQLSQLFRRGVVVPLGDDTAAQLARWSVDGVSRVEFLAIPDQLLFDEIWKAGIFQAINRACATMIDDYEEESLGPEMLDVVISVIVAKMPDVKDADVRRFADNLIATCRSAMEKRRSVYFIL